MEDQDVICISSDDEITFEKSSITASKIVKNYVGRTRASADKRTKRKIQTQISEAASLSRVKKSKIIDHGGIDDIIIVSPKKSIDDKSRLESTRDKIKRDQRKLGSKPCTEKPEKLPSTKHEIISSSSEDGETFRSDNNGIRSRNSNSKLDSSTREGKNIFAKSNDRRVLDESLKYTKETRGNKKSESSLLRICEDEVPRKIEKIRGNRNDLQAVRSRSPTTTIFQNASMNLMEKTSKNEETVSTSSDELSKFLQMPIDQIDKLSGASSCRVTGETSRDGRTIVPQKNIDPSKDPTKITEKSGPKNSSGNESSKSNKVEIVDTAEASTNNFDKTMEKETTMEDAKFAETGGEIGLPISNNLQYSRDIDKANESSQNSDCLNCEEIDSPKVSKVLKNREASETKSTDCPDTKSSNSIEIISPDLMNSQSLSSASTPLEIEIVDSRDVAKKSINPTVDEKSNGAKDENMESRKSDKKERVSLADVLGTIKKIDDDEAQFFQSSSPSKLPVVKKIEVVTRRIKPMKLNKSPELESTVEKNDSPQSSKHKDPSPAKKNFEPIAGCSKTPDDAYNGRNDNEKREILVRESYMTTPWSENPVETEKASPEADNSEKPHLVVKTKTPILSVDQDTFAMFLSLCLQIDRSSAMEKIVTKLKRNYELMNPSYSGSREFSNFLNEKREKIIARGHVYYYIGQVADEMKSRRNRKASSKNKERENEETVVEENKVTEESKDEAEENPGEDRRLRLKIKMIKMAMKKCSKRIRELEVAEVDFDEDNDSSYIKLECYKKKMVELYTKMCEYTNEHADAGRAYLRPKHLRVTQIPSIDQAINSFINSKLSYNRKKALKGKSFVDGLVFPDYVDILECVGKVNDQQNLGLDKRKQRKLAEDAFTQLGRHLQNARQKDYWDTFSLDLEKGEDPAGADPALSEKLLQNQEIAEQKTKEVFEEFVKKQEERNARNQGTSSEVDDNEAEDDDDDEEDNEDDRNNSNPGTASDSEDAKDEEKEPPRKKDNEEDNSSNVLKKSTGNAEAEESTDEKMDVATSELKIQNSTSINNKDSGTETKMDEDNFSNQCQEIQETEPEAEGPKELLKGRDEEELAEVMAEDLSIENNNVIETPKSKIGFESLDRPKEIPPESNSPKIQEIEDEPETEEAMEAETEQPKVLRIRSFAKPPSSWTNSQEASGKNSDNEVIIEATFNVRAPEVAKNYSNNSSTSRGLKKVSERTRLVKLDHPVILTSKNVAVSKNEIPSLTKILKTNEKLLNEWKNHRSLIRVQSSNEASINGRQIINRSLTTKNQSSLLDNSKAKAATAQLMQNILRRNKNVTTSTIPGTLRSVNLAHDITISGGTTTTNVHVRTLDTPQRIKVTVGKNLRPVSANRLQIVKLPDGCVSTSGNNGSSKLKFESNLSSRSKFSFPELQKNDQRTRMGGINKPEEARIVENLQAMESKRQPQILKLSNGGYLKAATATICSLDSSSSEIRGITLNNPRFIRVPSSSALASSATSGNRLINGGQLRMERIETAPQRNVKLKNRDCSIANISSRVSQPVRQIYFNATSQAKNDNSGKREYSRNDKRCAQKNWPSSNSEPPRKK